MGHFDKHFRRRASEDIGEGRRRKRLLDDSNSPFIMMMDGHRQWPQTTIRTKKKGKRKMAPRIELGLHAPLDTFFRGSNASQFRPKRVSMADKGGRGAGGPRKDGSSVLPTILHHQMLCLMKS
jgi:hypothetical protein